jgi:hypothetical protein
LEAQLTYSGNKKKGFPFLHCWLQVRNSVKFQLVNPKEKKKANSAKKQKTSNATSSSPILVDEAQGMGSPQTPKDKDLWEGSVQRNSSKTREEMMVHTRMWFRNCLLRRRKRRWI